MTAPFASCSPWSPRQALRLLAPAMLLCGLPAHAAPANHARPVPLPLPMKNAFPARFGVNLSGAEFGGQVLPGDFGTHYTYPTGAQLAYYRAKGRSLVRLPFRWERVQRQLNGPLEAAEVAYIRTFLQAAAQNRIQVLLDVHNYGRYYMPGEDPQKPRILGSPALPPEAFADLWSKLAQAFSKEPALFAYGLMNEPHDMEGDERWPRAAQAAVDAIRRHDAKSPIFVAGDHWSGARSWRDGSNETLHQKIKDPANNLVFEAHCYFDGDLSGSYKKSYDEEKATPDRGIDHVKPFVTWCREKGVRGFIGEFGGWDWRGRRKAGHS